MSMRAREKAERIRDMIAAKMSEGLPQVAESVVEKAVSIAPTPVEEYDDLMLGGDSIPDVPPLDGNRSADTDGRIRFMKPEGTRFIAEALQEPQNVEVSETRVRVGNLAFLEDQAVFEYTNKDGSTYRQGPYFKAFLNGTAGHLIIPVHFDDTRGGYAGRLAPGEGKDGSVKSMIKSISQRDMFDRETLRGVALHILRKVAAEIGPGNETSN